MVRLWEVETGRPLQTLTGYMSVVQAVRFVRMGARWPAGAAMDGSTCGSAVMDGVRARSTGMPDR